MWYNHFVIAWRNLFRQKAFSFINIFGLAIGLTCTLFITLYITDELGYDRFHQKADRIYRVALQLDSKSDPSKYYAVTAAPLAPALQNNFPEIRSAVRLSQANRLLSYENKHFYESNFFYTDSTFFDIFTFPLVKGSAQTALLEPNSIVITESFARKYFGEEDPLGKNITMGDSTLLRVTGVAQDVPENSHFHFDVLCSLSTYAKEGNSFDNWWNQDYYTYLLLRENASAADLEKKLARITANYIGEDEKTLGFVCVHFLQSLKSIHLESHLEVEIEANGERKYIYIFAGIAVFILLIACVNFMNLATAQSIKRAKEVGVRKVAGATRIQLILQFLSESILITYVALLVAIVLVQFLLPLFSELTHKTFTINSFAVPTWLFSLLSFGLIIGLLAGSYPAFFLSSYQVATVMKGAGSASGRGITLRKGLVIFQFSISTLLIIATIITWQQLAYMQNQQLGFNKEQVIIIPLQGKARGEGQQVVKNDLLKQAGILQASASSSVPGRNLSNTMIRPQGAPENKMQTMQTLLVDEHFLGLYSVQLAAGRNFSKTFRTDDSASFILNETAVQELGWGTPEQAIGKKFEWGLGKKGTIIGVVKDFHYNSLQQKIPAMVLHILPDRYRYLSLKVKTAQMQPVLEAVEETWKTHFAQYPFEYVFLDDDFGQQYSAEERLGKIVGIFSVLAIFVACLGLFGLASFTTEQRTKEIGIRKVLGASAPQIILLLSRDFTRLVLVAVVIAWPLAWYGTHRWLQDFAYRIDISWWIFGAAGLGTLLIALITVSFQAIKAAVANPVESLRAE